MATWPAQWDKFTVTRRSTWRRRFSPDENKCLTLWIQNVCRSQYLCGSPNPQYDGIWRRGFEAVNRSWMYHPNEVISGFMRRDKRKIIWPLPCKDIARRGPSTKQKRAFTQALNMPEPWSWTSKPPELWDMLACCLNYQSMVFWYSSLNYNFKKHLFMKGNGCI